MILESSLCSPVFFHVRLLAFDEVNATKGVKDNAHCLSVYLSACLSAWLSVLDSLWLSAIESVSRSVLFDCRDTNEGTEGDNMAERER